MGFNSVYKSLQEIFPQVDARLLRAVAIEHSKDVDLAAGVVLVEIIPFLSQKLSPATPPQDSDHGGPVNVEVESVVESEEEDNRLRRRQLANDINAGPSSAPSSISEKVTKTTDSSFGPDLNMAPIISTLSNVTNPDDADNFLEMDDELNIFQNAEDNGETSNKMDESFDQGQLDVYLRCENLISSIKSQEMEPDQNDLSKEVSSTNNNGNGIGNHADEDLLLDFVRPSVDDYGLEKFGASFIEVENSEAQAVCHVQGNTLNSKDSLQSELDASAGEKISDVVDDIGGKNAVSQYGQVCRIDMLEEIIDEAKTNKKTLFSSMESLINLMKEVELQEQAAEQAHIEAATGGSNILARVEEYKTMLVQAKEANDMHAGEVYGEKAILATELKELQSRLLSLSDERDNSLAILDEMRLILEARLAAAEESRKASEHEKLQKEESARKTLLEQEVQVEKVLHESGRLQQEAEENSKLREFLMDRGRVVDMLQGEISVICQDIRLLKEKFDANLPLSESFTSSQTSCKLASSGSSHKTLASDVGSEHSDSSEIGKTSRVGSIESLSSRSGHDEEKSKVDHNAPLDDGLESWDLLDRDAELNSRVH